tara:strand:- start:1682 stop:2176 length:495 start_codon:yes stop_codon:yes gene_type:complete
MSNEDNALMEETPQTDKDIINTQFTDLLKSLSGFKVQLTNFQQQIRVLEKNVLRQQKLSDKINKKKRKKSNKPSGFALPTPISEELSTFMSKEKGELVARTEVTRYIIDYIKTKKLQNPENGQLIIPDNALKKLLEIKEDESLSYFNLQKYMNRHFHKLTKEDM